MNKELIEALNILEKGKKILAKSHYLKLSKIT